MNNGSSSHPKIGSTDVVGHDSDCGNGKGRKFELHELNLELNDSEQS